MTALGNGVTADRILREWLARHPASMLIKKADDENKVSSEATRLRLVTKDEATLPR
ncbi:MAG: hypothetical protein NXI16_08010 [Alphaproteobacteria bacterium]|nr:hypothetical protein [Alphaproteobacteria bacterium]